MRRRSREQSRASQQLPDFPPAPPRRGARSWLRTPPHEGKIWRCPYEAGSGAAALPDCIGDFGKTAPHMPTEDVPAEGAPAAGNVPAPAESAAVGYPITFASAAPLQPRWLRPAIASAVILAHALAMVALANVSRPPPPAAETIEVNVIAAGDEAPVTTSAAQPSSEVAAEAKVEQSEAANGPAPQPPAPEPAPPAETPPRC